MRGLVVFLIGCGRLGFDDELSRTPSSQPAVIQTATLLDSATTVTVDIAATGRDNTIVVMTAAISAEQHVTAVVDDVGDHFESSGMADVCDQHDAVGEVWYSTTGMSGATAISITGAAADNREVWVLELAGVNELDKVATTSNAQATTSVVAPSVSPSAYPAIVISQLNDPSHVGNLAAGSPFVALPIVHGDDTAYAIVTTPGDYGAIWGNTVTGEFCGITAAFR